jgi:hypothetical protein
LSGLGGVGLVVESVVQAFERGAAEMVRGVEPVGRLEVSQELRVIEVVVVMVWRRPPLGRFDLVFRQFFF